MTNLLTPTITNKHNDDFELYVTIDRFHKAYGTLLTKTPTDFEQYMTATQLAVYKLVTNLQSFTLMMALAQVVKTSVNTNNSPSQDYTTNPDDHSNHNIDSPGFKPFNVIHSVPFVSNIAVVEWLCFKDTAFISNTLLHLKWTHYCIRTQTVQSTVNAGECTKVLTQTQANAGFFLLFWTHLPCIYTDFRFSLGESQIVPKDKLNYNIYIMSCRVHVSWW